MKTGKEMQNERTKPGRRYNRRSREHRAQADQRTGKRTEGVVARLLTNSSTHPHGIKVMLEDGQVGRVQEILET